MNKTIKRTALLLMILCLTAMLCGCVGTENNSGDTTASYRQISSAEAAELMNSEKDYIILDVRTQEEFAAGHIPNAICIPNETIGTDDVPELPDKEQLILVYCRSGRRSKEASQKLADLGYTNIVEFDGIIDWTGETVAEGE